MVIADEVYEHACFDGNKHVSIATLEGMSDRVMSFYSASKTFSCAGWRVGWVIGDESLIQPIIVVQNWNNLNIHRPAQISIGRGIEHVNKTVYQDGKSYYKYINSLLQKIKTIWFQS